MTAAAPFNALTPEHRHQLGVESGIPADIIEEEGLYSLGPDDPKPVPDPAFRHPNSYKGQRFPTWPEGIGAAIVFPHRDAHGRPNINLRPDVPRLVPKDDGTYRTVKYEHCGGARLSFYVPRRVVPVLQDITAPLRFTEGDKKTLAAVGRGFPTIGLSGVDCWKVQAQPKEKAPSETLPDLDDIALRGRIVLLEFDSDTASNPHVHAARRRFGDELRRRGAAVVDVDIPPAPDGRKQGIDDFLADGGDLAALENAALVKAILKPMLPPPLGGGTDGEHTCRECEPLREQIREYKKVEQLRRGRAFSSAETDVVAYYCRAVQSALSRGERTVSVWSDETTKLTGASAAAATRVHNQMRALQADPHLAATLPFSVVTEKGAKKKDHVRLVIADGFSAHSTADVLVPFTQLRRPGDRGSHGGARDRCPKCDGPMARTTQDRCINDACGHVVVHPTKIIGRRPFHDETVASLATPVATRGSVDSAPPRPPMTADAPPFHDETTLVTRPDGPPFHDETKGTSPFGKQDETVPPIPAAFVSDDDRRLADKPHGVALYDPPEDVLQAGGPDPAPASPPPPIAPPEDFAWWSRRHAGVAR